MKKYLIRLDDACPTMDAAKWQRMEDMLDRYGVRPMVGVIPANSDPKQKIDPDDTTFWTKVKSWGNKGVFYISYEDALVEYDMNGIVLAGTKNKAIEENKSIVGIVAVRPLDLLDMDKEESNNNVEVKDK